jgi:aryl carrier-like protein
MLALICAEVLRMEKISVEESLFDLGADSIHIFQITARATKAGLALTPRHILQHRTIAAIAAALDGDRAPVEERGISRVSRDAFRAKRPVA